YALDSFVVHPYDYVLKPIRKDKLTEIITELSIRTEKTKNKINIKTADGTAILDPDQISFIEKEGRHFIIHSQQGCFDTLLSIIDLEAILPQQFIKTHSAYIVNISKILTINPTNSRNYQICFSGYEKTAWISRGGFKKYKALFASDL
ncbi:MAG TPA: LytTR family transcriptional regulator DNA-binding domain-containing protein, partial [Syntrophomonas sp.]|nr:LytTR family transcriptional regulator DNA-binding domain-containing protein [Syntrophomonas sp.]